LDTAESALPESVDFYANTPPIFSAHRFCSSRAAMMGGMVLLGDGATAHCAEELVTMHCRADPGPHCEAFFSRQGGDVEGGAYSGGAKASSVQQQTGAGGSVPEAWRELESYLWAVVDLEKAIFASPEAAAEDRSAWQLEGHTGQRFSSMAVFAAVLSEVPWARTVCEVGFNAGHSANNWLVSGAARARRRQGREAARTRNGNGGTDDFGTDDGVSVVAFDLGEHW
jgi:hypothetical protein